MFSKNKCAIILKASSIYKTFLPKTIASLSNLEFYILFLRFYDLDILGIITYHFDELILNKLKTYQDKNTIFKRKWKLTKNIDWRVDFKNKLWVKINAFEFTIISQFDIALEIFSISDFAPYV